MNFSHSMSVIMTFRYARNGILLALALLAGCSGNAKSPAISPVATPSSIPVRDFYVQNRKSLSA